MYTGSNWYFIFFLDTRLRIKIWLEYSQNEIRNRLCS